MKPVSYLSMASVQPRDCSIVGNLSDQPWKWLRFAERQMPIFGFYKQRRAWDGDLTIKHVGLTIKNLDLTHNSGDFTYNTGDFTDYTTENWDCSNQIMDLSNANWGGSTKTGCKCPGIAGASTPPLEFAFHGFHWNQKKHCQRTKVCSKMLKIMLSSQCGLLLGSLHYRHETCATRILPVLPSWNNQPSLSSCPLPNPGSPLLIPHCRMTIGCWETKGGEAKPEKTLHLSQAPPTPTIST